jgi:hypothetical protein
MDRPQPTDLLLAARPDAPGARVLVSDWTRAAASRPDARVLLVGEGLDWAADAGLPAMTEHADVAVCSRNANDAGWRLETAPAGVRWSSVATWLAERAPGTALWAALP